MHVHSKVHLLRVQQKASNPGLLFRDAFVHNTSTGGDASPVDGSILSQCLGGETFPSVFILSVQFVGGGARLEATFMTLASQNSGSFKDYHQ